MDKKSLLIGILIGMVVSAPVVWAAGQITWVFPNGEVAGTVTNPLYIAIQ